MPPTRTAQKSIHRDTYIYKQIGANAIELDVIGLRSDMTQPCVVWIHGGGLIFGWRKTSPRESFLRSLIERGFVIISIDHRLAPETRLPAIIGDVQDAWAWVHEFAVPRLGAYSSEVDRQIR